MGSILLAEDDSSMKAFLAGALRRDGHDVTAVENGEEALALLEERFYDLLLTDIFMPGMNGIELSKRALALHPKLKRVFITGFTAVALEENPDLMEEAPVFSKPFHLREVVERVKQILSEGTEEPEPEPEPECPEE